MEAIPHSHAEQIRQVAQNEGAVLTRIEGLIFLVTLAALFASALAVSAAMATAIFERRAEVGLMKALGAGKFAVASIFFAEATLLALIGGVVGFAAGGLLAHQIGRSIFNSEIAIPPVLVARDPGDRGDRYFCGKRSGDSQCGATGSGVCVAR
jgi:putative ABC transport system permease protein